MVSRTLNYLNTCLLFLSHFNAIFHCLNSPVTEDKVLNHSKMIVSFYFNTFGEMINSVIGVGPTAVGKKASYVLN